MHTFRPGQWVVVQHLKPWKKGSLVQMRGMVTAAEGAFLRLHRLFRVPGRAYDGLYATQSPGDWGTIELIHGGWVARRRYFRADGELVGESYNIQTPTNFTPGEARYVDLEIDVVLTAQPGRRVEVQDEEDLRLTIERGHIPEALGDIARRIAYELADRVSDAAQRHRLAWDVRPEDVGFGHILQLNAREAQDAFAAQL